MLEVKDKVLAIAVVLLIYFIGMTIAMCIQKYKDNRWR